MDRYILIIANLFSAVSVIMLYRLNPETALRQVIFIGIGMAAMVVIMAIVRNYANLKKHVVWYSAAAFLLLMLPMAFGREIGGARNWINVLGIGVQPSEFVKLLLVVVTASLLSGHMSMKRMLLAAGFTVACLGILMLEKDLGAALLYTFTFMVIFYAATNNLLLTGAGLGAAAGAAILSYNMFSHVRIRVEVWRNPWLSYDTNGYQIVQGLMAIASLAWGWALARPRRYPPTRPTIYSP